MDAEVRDDRDAWCLLAFGTRAVDVNTATTTGTVAATLGGGLVMAATTKLVAAGLVIAVATAWWLWPRDVSPKHPAETPAPALTDGTAAPSRRGRLRTGAAEPSEEVAASGAGAPTEVPLGPEVVRGRVVDAETGTAVANVTVSLVWESMPRTGEEPSAVSAADGTFRIADATSATFGALLLRATGYADCVVRPPWLDETTKLAKNDAGDVRIHRGKRIAGRVIGADGRTPVVGATLWLAPGGPSAGGMALNSSVERGTSGERGVFTIERVPPSPGGPYVLVALSGDGVGWANLPATGGRADLDGIEVVLRVPASVAVTVIDEFGAPQIDAQVIASPRFEPLGQPRYWNSDHEVTLREGTDIEAAFGAKTDASGIARFARLPTGDDCGRYDFIVRGRATAWQDGVAVEPGRNTSFTIILEVPRVATVVAGVRVVDPSGAPVEGAKVVVRAGPAGAEATSGPDGVAIVRREEGAVRAGVWGWFDVTKDGFAKRMVGIELVADDGTPLQTVALERPAPVDGRITDQHGVPIAGCHVELLREGEQLSSPTTGADGSFSFPDATAGSWTLRHHPPPPFDLWRYDEYESPVEGGQRKLAIVLHRLPIGKARLVVKVVDGDSGAPLSADEAQLIPETRGDEPIRSADADKDFRVGSVSFERVRPGRYSAWVRVPARGAFVTDVDVTEGPSEVTATIVAGRPGTLRGRLDLAGTEPTKFRWVSIGRPDDWCTPQWGGYRTAKISGGELVAPDGTFVFERLNAGRYRLWAEQDVWLGEAFAEVPAGGEANAVVTFVRGGTVSFSLTAPSPSNRLDVEVAEGPGPWKHVMSIGGVKGKAFREEQTLRPGRCRWRVKFPADEFVSTRVAAKTQEGEVVVVAGETAVVDVPVVVLK
jgi:hypothetical protein